MKKGVAVTIVMLFVLVATAGAHVAMHGSAKLPVVRAAFKDPALTDRLIYDCFAADRSTVNRGWAVT